ncbi:MULTISPECIES: fumarylacetoacetate hydrolase family protein [unclassified Niallia]|uniref:fumarylacetoacetate hydrolase family protein n=1 Tax=unclassified Niallia TaxID=2837522 RepID=UPI001EDBD07D|nr:MULTISPECIES: fumarylacetoacetate hydrolase family protein [unclassified Niallia]MCM3030430.1 fumarylacetoacetate hydrolase family protein [Niallia sp. MER 6]MDL0434646.1 fumarylacetoacetate hydrolase family protein [Niallia sp. SS-2023]UPO88392.1 fumarylacetoacetate hydrolase family protein [Niallia sp. Man26]
MKFATVLLQGRQVVAVLNEKNKTIIPLNDAEEQRTGSRPFPDDLIQCIEMGNDFIDKAREATNWANENSSNLVELDEVKLLAPIPTPRKNIFCVGKNYEEHAIEMGSKDDIPEHVMVFTKAPTTVIGPDETVPDHSDVSEQLDYEGELCVVIGKKGKAIPQDKALEYVFGYTILNDITARDLQARHKQFFIGKSLDGSGPLGPVIVEKSAISNPNKLNISTKINGEVRQNSNTAHFIFPIEEVISVLSKGMTLEPGDLIATGTPAGVGKGFKPPRFLKAGDTIEIEVEGIGVLRNTVG